MGCSTEDFYSNYSLDLRALGYSDSEIINILLELEMHDEKEDFLLINNWINKKPLKAFYLEPR